jgi:hypothetical protein
MSFDAHKNLAIATVTTATGAAGTTLGVGVGEGARFPAAPFNATVWPFDMAPDPTTAEVVRVTARTGDSLTITRAQEGTTARAIIVGDFVAATITAKSLTDIESGVNFPLIATPGTVTAAGLIATTQQGITRNANNDRLNLIGGVDGTTGAYLSLFGQVHSTDPGNVRFVALNPSGKIEFITGASATRGVMHPSGGFSWGGTTDPGAGNFLVNGLSNAQQVVLNPGGADTGIRLSTADGADNGNLYLTGGGAIVSPARGAFIVLAGNEAAGAGGDVSISAGAGTSGKILFNTNFAQRAQFAVSGGFSVGNNVDPGPGSIFVGGGVSSAPGQAFVWVHPDSIDIGHAGTAAANTMVFYNANGVIGSIITSTSTTAFNTTSDARLKTPLSLHTDTEVLRRTVIREFVWKSDGTKGRGVFAQEAYAVAPFAVSVGTDDVDDQGRLTQPWGVDYSKFVPDLITGWKHHDTRIGALFSDQILAAERLTALEKRLNIPQPALMTRLRTALRAVWDFVKGPPGMPFPPLPGDRP